MAIAKDANKALDVIGKTLATKEEIDREFNIFEYKNCDMSFLDDTSDNIRHTISPTDNVDYSVKFKINTENFGFNVISNLTLGRAFELVHNEERDKYDYRISPDARRARFSDTEMFKLNEKWLRYVLDKISKGKNSILVLDDLFTQVTTGNYRYILPYKEQFAFIVALLEEYPEALKKVVAIVRGPVAKKIIEDGGQDLMKMLAERLDMQTRLVDGDGELRVTVKGPKNKNNEIKIRSYNPKGHGRKSFFKNFEAFIQDNPGYDIYYNTSMRNNMFSIGITSCVEGTKMKDKPCGIICFGPMSEYDYFNVKRQNVGEYNKNCWWYRIGFEQKNINNENRRVAMPHWEDYTFPHYEKEDTIDSLSINGSDMVAEVLNQLANSHFDRMNRSIDQIVVPKVRKKLKKITTKHKLKAMNKDEFVEKLKKPSKPIERKVLNPSYQPKIEEKGNQSKSKQTKLIEEEKTA